MKKVRKGSIAALLAAFALILGIITPSVAQASSSYDALLHTSPSLFVYTDGATKSQKMDISQSWLDSLGQTYAKRVAQNIGWPTNFMTELNDIAASGGSLGVIMHETSDGNTVEVIGSRDPNAYCGFVGDASTGSFQCTSHAGYGYIDASYFTHSSFGGNGCMGSGMYLCSDDGMNIYASPTVQTGTAGYTMLNVGDVGLSNYTFYYMHFNLSYPTGYAGAMIPTSPPAATYVAMGDSFSSGEGNPAFTPGTNTSSDTCHRSAAAYPQLLQNALDLGATAFVACSGATTDAIIGTGGFKTEPPQINALSNSTQVVTLTIGGNDVDFKGYATACTVAVCGPGTSAYDTIMNVINSSGFYDNLVAAYESILIHAYNAQVYVSGYPYLATQTSGLCGVVDLSGVWAVEQQLNTVIGAAVDDVRLRLQPTSHLHYVDPTLWSSPFTDKYLCNGGASDFNGLDLIHQEYSFHPDTAGHQDFASVFESQMS